MKKSKVNIWSIVIFSFLFGFIATSSALAVADFSGNWNGQWFCNTHGRQGSLQINLTQSGTLINGTMIMAFPDHGCTFNSTLTGNISGDKLYFTANGDCGSDYGLSLEFFEGELIRNSLSGNYTISRWNCRGPFTLTRSVNPSVYTISASAGTGGTITPSGSISVSAGANQTFTISPNSGYKIVDVLVDGVSAGAINSYTFPNVSANHSIIANFSTDSYTISATAGPGGTITPAGNISVNPGNSQTFTISPSNGYRIVDVLVDGASVGAKNSYTFSGVSANHSIIAAFEKIANLPFLQLLLE